MPASWREEVGIARYAVISVCKVLVKTKVAAICKEAYGRVRTSLNEREPLFLESVSDLPISQFAVGQHRQI